MNDRPLTAEHGYPVRVVVPGVSGCRSIKWLNSITIQSEESKNLYQRYDYKRLPPEATNKEAAKKYWDITPALQDMPVNSVIGRPQTGETIELSPSGTIEAKGYALPQGAYGPIVKVEVSVDNGRTWTVAELLSSNKESRWSWVLWKANIRIAKGKKNSILSRATDAGGNMQNDDTGKW